MGTAGLTTTDHITPQQKAVSPVLLLGSQDGPAFVSFWRSAYEALQGA